jgi:hypothetical protein
VAHFLIFEDQTFISCMAQDADVCFKKKFYSGNKEFVTCRGLRLTYYKTGSGLDDWIY